jgi:hypothetical protein
MDSVYRKKIKLSLANMGLSFGIQREKTLIVCYGSSTTIKEYSIIYASRYDMIKVIAKSEK